MNSTTLAEVLQIAKSLPAVSDPIQLARSPLERAVDRLLKRADEVKGDYGRLRKELVLVAAARRGAKFDSRKHAPMCPANHYHHGRVPGQCTCRPDPNARYEGDA